MIHIGRLIEEELHRQERTVTWLAAKLYCDRSNVYKIFKKQSIDTELLVRLSRILGRNFFEAYTQAVKPDAAGNCNGGRDECGQ